MHIRTIKGRKYLYHGNHLVKKVDILDEFYMSNITFRVVTYSLTVLFFLTILAYIVGVFNAVVSSITAILICVLLFVIGIKVKEYVKK